MVAEYGDEFGGKRNGSLVLKEQAETFAELNDKAGAELARELDFNEAGISAGQSAGWIGVWFGHPGEDARSAAGG